MKNTLGFTLLELMMVVAIVSIFTMVAIPSYQTYVRKAVASQAQQEMQKLAIQLERHRSRNFSYQGFDASYLYQDSTGAIIPNFDASDQQLTLPLDRTMTQYTLTIVDPSAGNVLLTASTATGQKWAIKAVSVDTNNYTLLLTSDGVQCKNKTKVNVSYSSCGTGSEEW